MIDLTNQEITEIAVAGLVLVQCILRVVPTTNDYSLLNKFKKLVDFIIPNLKNGGGKF